MKQLLSTTLLVLVSGLTIASASEKKAIVPESAKKNISNSPFSPAILKDGTLYVSGNTGYVQGKTPEVFEDEVKAAFENIQKVLKEAGYDFKDVVTVQVYMTDIGLIDRMNVVYKTYFPEPRPARTTVGVAKLVGTAHIEITVTAKH
jgi:2-iminobutanoate/2-iminopropanoate deaminase